MLSDDRYISHIMKYVDVSGLSYEDLEDLRQEGHIALMRAKERFDPNKGCKLSTYAFTIVRNAMINWLRREGYKRRPLVEFSLEEHDTPIDPNPLLDRLHLSSLDCVTKHFLTSIYIKGESYSNMGKRVGIKPHQIKRQLDIAIEYLKTVESDYANQQRL